MGSQHRQPCSLYTGCSCYLPSSYLCRRTGVGAIFAVGIYLPKKLRSTSELTEVFDLFVRLTHFLLQFTFCFFSRNMANSRRARVLLPVLLGGQCAQGLLSSQPPSLRSAPPLRERAPFSCRAAADVEGFPVETPALVVWRPSFDRNRCARLLAPGIPQRGARVVSPELPEPTRKRKG